MYRNSGELIALSILNQIFTGYQKATPPALCLASSSRQTGLKLTFVDFTKSATAQFLNNLETAFKNLLSVLQHL